MASCSEGKPFSVEKDGTRDAFSIYNHISVTKIMEDGSSEGELEVHPDSLNLYNIVHGGALAALAAGDLGGVARRMYNVFEDVLPRKYRAVEPSWATIYMPYFTASMLSLFRSSSSRTTGWYSSTTSEKSPDFTSFKRWVW